MVSEKVDYAFLEWIEYLKDMHIDICILNNFILLKLIKTQQRLTTIHVLKNQFRHHIDKMIIPHKVNVIVDCISNSEISSR